ncbi:hypothetical protein Acsp03_63670 [Actinomadura sp. NBRC 104412]|uniref:DUF6339 family protein n=1 Tax=Actinomadura sp. NBRC 104412 TaxID=3032203 RepID=UPI0024A0BC7A|nr:DUF6339 family protein [Actinomadura sp. NBRC 104412]GLZ08901.1 hypothetical protein Acsp03_63670 [Actinomadura sp. NBRC 104412]
MSTTPERLALLPDEVAVGFLTTAVLQEREPLPMAAIDKACEPFPDEPRWSAEPVRELIIEAMKRFGDERTDADAWLAPRLHATLRLTRREASEAGLWNHLALRVAPDYVFWRHLGRSAGVQGVPTVNRNRFCGPYHSQAFARLWWAAELFRDGYDYGPSVVACGNQDVLNTVLRLEVILHRPTAQAILHLLSDGTVRTGRDVNALAQAVNAAGTTLFFEAIAPDADPDPDAYLAWIEELDTTHVPLDDLPHGPDDGRAPLGAVNTLVPIFKRLFAEAPVRGKRRPEADEPS